MPEIASWKCAPAKLQPSGQLAEQEYSSSLPTETEGCPVAYDQQGLSWRKKTRRNFPEEGLRVFLPLRKSSHLI